MPRILSFSLCLLLLASPAAAYIGPGVGAGVIATVLGILGALALFVVAVFWFPIKRLLARRRGNTRQNAAPASSVRADMQPDARSGPAQDRR